MRLQRRPNGQNYAGLSSAWGDYKYVSSKRWRGVPTYSPYIAPTINPTVAFVYGAQQTATVAAKEAAKENACTQLRNEYAQYGKVFNPNQEPKLTVIEVLHFRGVDPTINTGVGSFLEPLNFKLAIACSS